MKIIGIKKKTKHLFYNIETDCKLTKVYVTVFGVKTIRIHNVFLCVKSQRRKRMDVEHEEYLQSYRDELVFKTNHVKFQNERNI